MKFSRIYVFGNNFNAKFHPKSSIGVNYLKKGQIIQI